VLEVNLMGTYWMAQACARLMLPGSSIVNVASTLAFIAPPAPQAAYAASKSGLIGLTRDLPAQWAGRRGHPGERARTRLRRHGDDGGRSSSCSTASSAHAVR